MVTLPAIEDYSKKEIEELATFSRVFNLYYQKIATKAKTFSEEVRIEKHKSWLKAALASYHDRLPAESICFQWTQATDQILLKAWKHFALDQNPLQLFALGKLGSMELNLSSDIDIIFVLDEENVAKEITNQLKLFVKCLSDSTDYGFAYRVDMNLRPGGLNSPIITTKSQFFNYYDAYLEAWNRLSFIRLRPVTKKNSLSEKIVDYCRRNAFPRRLDFSVIDEIKNIRSKINYQWRKTNEPFDIKLSPGGIRDIELLAQSLQVIYGGKNRNLQTFSFSKALSELANQQIISEEDFKFLGDFYWKLRQIENLIHIQEDQHTYLIRNDFFKNKLPIQGSEAELRQNLDKSDEIVSDFFNDKPSFQKAQKSDLKLTEKSKKAIEQIRDLKSHSLKRHNLSQMKSEILQHFILNVEKISVDQNMAVETFRDFIFSIKSKSSIFHLLHRHPKLIEDLAWLFSVSPFIGQLLCRRPELMDSFVLGQVEVNLEDDFETFLESIGDYKQLGQLFAVIDLFKNRNIDSYCTQLSRHANFIVSNLQNYLKKALGSQSSLQILCMGKWSGFELGIQSDLDFVFLSDQEPQQDQFKLARRLINNLTQTSSSGRLYDIDLRLKPNESAGPLILESSRLVSFMKNEAEAWQKQAYLRSRIIDQDSLFFKDNFELLRLSKDEVVELEKVHDKLLKPSSDDSLDLKTHFGGIIHTEFLIQKWALQGETAPKSSRTLDILESLNISNDLKIKLAKNYQKLRLFEQSLQIGKGTSSTKVSKSDNQLQALANILALGDFFESCSDLLNEQRELLKSLDLNH